MTLVLVRKDELEDNIHRIADALQPEIKAAFLNAMDTLRGKLPVTALADLLDEGDLLGALQTLSDITLTPEQLSPIRDAISSAAVQGAELTAAQFGLSFNAVNDRAVAYATAQAANLVTAVDENTVQAIRDIIVRGQLGDVNVREQSQLIREFIGLTSRDMRAVDRFYTNMIDNGFRQAQARTRAERMARRLLNRRAENIARTETIRAANTGTELGWLEAQDKGLLPRSAVKVWIATEDSRTCPICALLDGKQVDVGGSFDVQERADTFTVEGGVISVRSTVPLKRPTTTRTPPAHPSCRCTVGIELADGGEVVVEPPPDVLPDLDSAHQTQEMRTHMSGPLEQFGLEQSAPAKMLDVQGMSIDDIPQIERKWNDLIDDGEFRIDLDRNTVSQILDDGRVKSQFEVGMSNGSFNPDLRSDFEHRYFGLADDTNLPFGERPIYGYVGESGKGASTFYGDTTLVLKDSVKDRSTLFFGDSLSTDVAGGSSQAIPFRPGEFDFVENVQHDFLGEGAVGVRNDLFDAPSLSKVPGHNEYVEAQFWGGVRLSDISEIRFLSRPTSDLRDALDAAGIEWSVVTE